MIDRRSKIYVAGHQGMVGSALMRRLKAGGYNRLVAHSRSELDLLNPTAVLNFLEGERPSYIFIAAAKVGGIGANADYPADFLYQNLLIEANLIQAAHAAGVQRLMFLGSSCIYPRECPQPIKEEYLLTGPLEPTNEAYAVAKIAGIKLAENYSRQHGRQYVSVMPTNLYGPSDNYDLSSSHVLPALIRKAHEAKLAEAPEMSVWGSGNARREFLYVDDLADACVHLMEIGYDGGLVNIGVGTDITIANAARMVAEVVGFTGEIRFDLSRPEGMPRKLLDVSRMTALGWRARTSLAEGLSKTYALAPFAGLKSANELE